MPDKTSIFCMCRIVWDGKNVRAHVVATLRISQMLSHGVDTRSVSVQMLSTGRLGCTCYRGAGYSDRNCVPFSTHRDTGVAIRIAIASDAAPARVYGSQFLTSQKR